MSLFKKLFAVASTVAMLASGLAFTAPAALATAHGPGSVVKTSDGTVWFIDSSNKRSAFTSGGAFLTYGFLSFSQVVDANSDDIALANTGSFIAPRDGSIFCATATKGTDVAGECSLITGGMKAAFTSASVFAGQGFSFSRAQYGDSSFLTKTSNIDNAGAAHRQGVLVNQSGTVYLVGTSTLLGIPSVDVFNSWGYSFADVVPANAADMSMTKSGVMCARVAGQLNPSFSGTCSTPETPADCNNLSGSTGSVDLNALSDFSGEEVGEGEEDVPVMTFEVEADNDSDVAITSVKVELDENGAGSEDLDDYASEVSIWHGDDMIGSADVDDFDESDTTDGTWTKTISLDCAVVGADDTEEFTVAVTANDNIDSGDLNQAWIADVISLRFEDGDGVTTTEDTDGDSLEKSFTFQSFANATDVELNATLTDDAEDINDAHIIDIDDNDDTEDVEILAFTLENKGDSDITVNDIPVVLTTTGETDEAVLLLNATLWMDGDQISSDTVPTGGSIEFEDVDLDIDADDSVDLVVAVDIQDTTGAADNGDTVQATLTVGSIDAEDEEGDDVTNLTGTAVGQTHAVYDAGIMTEFVDSDATRTLIADAAGEFDQGTFNITFDVTAFDGDMRIDRSCEEGGADAAGQGVEYTITNSGSNSTTCVLTSSDTDSEDTANTFEVDEDTTRTFTLTVNATSSADAFAEVALESINWGTATNDTNANYYNFDLGDYKTNAIFLNTF